MCLITVLVVLSTMILVPHGAAQQRGAVPTVPSKSSAAVAARNLLQQPRAWPAWSTYSVRASRFNRTKHGQQAPGLLNSTGLKQQVQLSLNSETQPQLGASFGNLTVQIIPETESRLHVKIHPSGEKRVEVLQHYVTRPGTRADLRPSRMMYQLLQPLATPNRPFALVIAREHSLEPIFDTRGHMLVFKEKFMELTTTLPRGAQLYRLQQQQQQQPKVSTALTSWPGQLLSSSNGFILTPWGRDNSSSSKVPATTTASPYTFYLQVNPDGQSHGVLLLSNNVTDVMLNKTALTYRLSDGIFELYFFLGPSPQAVLRQYSKVVGSKTLAALAEQQQQQQQQQPADSAAMTAVNTTVAAGSTINPITSPVVTGKPLGSSGAPAPINNTASHSEGASSNGDSTITSAAAAAAAAAAAVPATPSNTQHSNATATGSKYSIDVTVTNASSAAAAAATPSPAKSLLLQLQRYIDGSSFLAINNAAGALALPLMVTDPADARARLASSQYLLGDALLVSPTSRSANVGNSTTLRAPAASSTGSSSSSNSSSSAAANSTTQLSSTPPRAYFTAGNWYSIDNFKRFKVTEGKAVAQKAATTGGASAHIRGGSILPLVNTSSSAAATTAAAAAQDAQSPGITLVVALPLEAASKRTILGQPAGGGPLAPYSLDAPCLQAHWDNPGQLVSCGFLYGSDSVSPDTSNTTLQVWYIAVTAEGGRSGTISNLALSRPKDTPHNSIIIQAIDILGVPGTASDKPFVSVYGGGNTAKASYDAAKEVLSIRGLQLGAAAALNIDWRLRKQSAE